MTHTTNLFSLALLCAFAGCSNNDTTVKPDNAGLSAAGAAGMAGAQAKPIPTSCRQDRPGPPMVLIPKPDGAFCIDRTETTRGQYQEFLKAVGNDPGKFSVAADVWPDCKGNLWFFPSQKAPPGPPGAAPKPGERVYCWDYGPAGDVSHPGAAMNCIDDCDAVSFCAWAGKRLCTADKYGTDYGTDRNDKAAAGEWNLACSNGGKTTYPYGDQYKAGACHDFTDGQPVGVSSTEPDTAPACRGLEAPYDQVVDMSGGVGEYTTAGVKGWGTVAGGDWGCWSVSGGPGVDVGNADIGIRCCADD